MKRRGSTELVSIILGVVIIGALALAVAGSFSKQSKESFNTGMKTQTQQLVTNANEAIQNKEAEPVPLQQSAK